MATHLSSVAALSDVELLTQLSTLVKKKQDLIVAVLVHLAEVERRGLHLAKGCSSLFAYCVERLGFSEDVAYKRVGASRYGRRFPLALDLLAQGALHLSALMSVGPHLTESNHRDWLMAAAGKSKRDVEKLVATRCPKSDVAPSVRKLPNRQAQPNTEGIEAAAVCSPKTRACSSSPGDTAGDAVQQSSASATRDADRRPSSDGVGANHPIAACARASDRPRVQPLSSCSYRIVFTASEALKQKLDRARELCSHSVAPSDLPALLELALELLIEREEKRRFAVQSPKIGSRRRTSEPLISKSPISPSTPSHKSEQAPDPAEPALSGDRQSAPRPPSHKSAQAPGSPDPAEPGVPDKRSSVRDRSYTRRREPDQCDRGLATECLRNVRACVRRAV